ncbi:MAG: hypothetical protein U0838_09235 [Chloroflexota bacterium]
MTSPHDRARARRWSAPAARDPLLALVFAVTAVELTAAPPAFAWADNTYSSSSEGQLHRAPEPGARLGRAQVAQARYGPAHRRSVAVAT